MASGPTIGSLSVTAVDVGGFLGLEVPSTNLNWAGKIVKRSARLIRSLAGCRFYAADICVAICCDPAQLPWSGILRAAPDRSEWSLLYRLEIPFDGNQCRSCSRTTSFTRSGTASGVGTNPQTGQ